ncbi:MAG: hypothetical protein PHQ60_06930 [Sideroxydans sp.]|nr:hypothetical protein [Sideroxydans sp.]
MRAGIGIVAVLVGMLGLAADIAVAQENDSGRSTSNAQGADTSELHKFEKSVQPSPPENQQNRHHADRSHDSEHDDGFGSELLGSFTQAMMELTMNMFAAGGASSLQRLDQGAGESPYRNKGEPVIPFARYDFAYQQVSSDITAHVNRFEGGYGPAALLLEDYTFNESAPSATLDIKRQMVLYRMSVGQHEVDLGLGQSTIVGMQRTSISAVSVRVRFMLGENISIDVNPVWGDGMDDYELALHYGMQYGALKIGYRSLNTPGASLSGPFAGLALYY